MIFDAFRKSVAVVAELTPNAFIPKLLAKITHGGLSVHDSAELYLVARFLFAFALATLFSKSLALTVVVGLIQASSLIYLLRIVFPVGERTLKDPSRSLFFAFGHYIEIGLSMGYVYWCLGAFNDKTITISKSVYFSFVTMTTIGYGDVTPDSDITRLLVTVHTIVGVFMLATVIGLFLSLSSSGQQSNSQLIPEAPPSGGAPVN
jgi:hypothetical protein